MRHMPVKHHRILCHPTCHIPASARGIPKLTSLPQYIVMVERAICTLASFLTFGMKTRPGWRLHRRGVRVPRKVREVHSTPVVVNQCRIWRVNSCTSHASIEDRREITVDATDEWFTPVLSRW